MKRKPYKSVAQRRYERESFWGWLMIIFSVACMTGMFVLSLAQNGGAQC